MRLSTEKETWPLFVFRHNFPDNAYYLLRDRSHGKPVFTTLKGFDCAVKGSSLQGMTKNDTVIMTLTGTSTKQGTCE